MTEFDDKVRQLQEGAITTTDFKNYALSVGLEVIAVWENQDVADFTVADLRAEQRRTLTERMEHHEN